MINFKEYLDNIAKKTFLESISGFPNEVQQHLLSEIPATHFLELPSQFKFLQGAYVDLGFENLGLNKDDYTAICRAFGHHGVGIPNTNYKLQFVIGAGYSAILPADGTELSLPDYWREAIFVVQGNQFTWIGKRVRPDQIGTIDYEKYRDVGEGWELI